ncbi:MAG: HdeD family acid-resistance protein [Bacillota bacterium]|nr:HdeD family acid-resistance protein [Bacillota bacterium]
MRVFKIAAGVILVITGIFCFAAPGATFVSVAFILGCAMLLSGISGVTAYIWIGKKREVPYLLLAEGVTSILLGILVLTNQIIAEAAIPVFFGLWVLFSGVLRVSDGISRMKQDSRDWTWLVILGAVGTITGMYSFFNTVLFHFSPVMLTGILFVMQGIHVLTAGVSLSFHPRKKAKAAK